jgi:hypothetical protein
MFTPVSVKFKNKNIHYELNQNLLNYSSLLTAPPTLQQQNGEGMTEIK